MNHPRKLLLAALLPLVGGCSGAFFEESGSHIKKVFSSDSYRFYRMDIAQGNLLDEETIARIRPGLTKEQIVYLLGRPILPSMFHDERWDYIYYLNSLQKKKRRYFKLTLFFDDDRVVRVRKPKRREPEA